VPIKEQSPPVASFLMEKVWAKAVSLKRIINKTAVMENPAAKKVFAALLLKPE
jgi:hypothetical protein